jgi:hypothetical protein
MNAAEANAGDVRGAPRFRICVVAQTLWSITNVFIFFLVVLHRQ